MNLRIPGPTPMRDEVVKAIARPMINHRSPAMASLFRDVRDKLARYLATEAEILLLAASGTAGLEAAIVNTLSAGDAVLGVSGGVFGERFCKVAEAYGVRVDRIEVPWGSACETDRLRSELAKGSYRAVLMTHNETSTGVLHPVADMSRVVKEESPDTLILVDAISSLGAAFLPIDGATDLVVSGSQKAWGLPPGLTMVFAGDRVWESQRQATLPRFYLDLARYREAAATGSFPNTPATSVLFGLDAALDVMLTIGAEKIFQDHQKSAAATRASLGDIGVELFADPRFASPTVTSICMPDGIDGRKIASDLRDRFRIEIGGGQGKLGGKILRIGHLGWIVQDDLDACVDALADCLARAGFSPASA